MHGKELCRNVVEHEEECAARGEDRQEAGELLPDETASDLVESALDEGPATVVGEVAHAAEAGLDAAPHQPFIERPLVVGAGIDRQRLDGARVGEQPHRHEEQALDDEIEDEGPGDHHADQAEGVDIGKPLLGQAHTQQPSMVHSRTKK